MSLDGTGSSDPDVGDTLSYLWTQDAGPGVTLGGATTATPNFTAPVLGANDSAVQLVFSLVVTDDKGNASAPDTVTITVNPPANQAPTADAGPAQSVASGAAVSLDGTGSSDPDVGDTLSYLWTQDAGPGVTLGGATTATPNFTAPVLGANDSAVQLVFSLVVTDDKGNASAPDTVTITVNPPANQAPTADAGPAQSVASGAAVSLDGTGSSDPDVGDTLSYLWTQDAGPGVTLGGATTATPNFTAPVLGANDSAVQLVFSLVVTDDKGNASAPDTVTITVNPPANQAPTADAGPAQSVASGAAVSLDGTGSSDPDVGDTLSYLWTQDAGPGVTLGGATTATPNFTAPVLGANDSAVQLVFSLVVTDDKGNASAPDTVTITVNPPANQAPTADAGPAQSVASGAAVSLDGTGSSDPDVGDTLSYLWTQDAGPGVTLGGATTATPNFTAPVLGANDSAVQLVFSLVVTDDKGNASAPDTVTITVNPPANQAPTADAGPAQSVASGAAVSLDGTGSTDPEGSTLSYAWTQTSGPAAALTGALTVYPGFTAPTLAAGSPAAVLVFSLVVTDPLGASSAPDTVAITVNPPANVGPTANAGPDQTAASGASVALTGAASTDPEGGTLSYAWTQTSGPAVALTGALTVSPGFTAPTLAAGSLAAVLVFSLVVTDPLGASSAPDTVTITVNPPSTINIAQVQQDFSERTGALISRRMERALNSDPRMYRLEHRPRGSSTSSAGPTGVSVSQGEMEFALRRTLEDGSFFWAEGVYSDYEDQRDYGRVDGTYGVLHFGADTNVGSTVIGLMASIDRISEEETDQDLSGTGWMVGPYFSTAITEQLFLSGRVTFGQSQNDAEIISSGNAMTADFETERLLSVLTLTGETALDHLVILPEVSLGYARENQDDYTATDGDQDVWVPGRELEYGQVAIAAEFQYPVGPVANEAFLYARPAIVGVFEPGDLSSSSDLSASLEVGYEATPSDLLWHGISIAYDGMGDDAFEATTIRAFVEMRF